jgi:hypothetical protein
MSSAYYKIDRLSSSICGITPNICPSNFALLIRIANINNDIKKDWG